MSQLPIIQPEPTSPSRLRVGWRGWVFHFGRLGLLLTIAALIRLNANASRSAPTGELAPSVTVERIRAFLPAARAIAKPDGDQRFPVIDAEGEIVGHVMQTSPASDQIIGFSGPTNVLIAQKTDGTIAGVEIIGSSDTREHVRVIENEPAFFDSFVGTTRQDLRRQRIDAVSGATLTSLAIVESVANRLGGEVGSLRFPEEIVVEECRELFPAAASLKGTSVLDVEGKLLGTVLRISPAADNTIGYQGPTDAIVGFDPAGEAVGLTLRRTYDNEKYVTYVREDDYFRSIFNGRSLAGLAALDLEAEQIEGVSGATMTSMAVASGVVEAARKELAQRKLEQGQASRRPAWAAPRTLGTAIAVLLGIIVCFTRLRGKQWARVPLQLFLIGYLGFVNGDLISQAMFVGWAKSGIPWRTASGLVILAVVSLALPLTTGRNAYCTHICPHGAAQQLLMNRGRRIRLGGSSRRLLKLLPLLLLLVVVIVGMGRLDISLVDLEAFDAYVPAIAGFAAIGIAIGGLIASAFIPMAYCRLGCPTGAVLEFLRLNRLSGRFGKRDLVAIALLILVVALSVT